MCSKMSIFKPCQKNVSPLVNDNEQGPSGGGGAKEKLITFLLRGRMIGLTCCNESKYHLAAVRANFM